MAVKVVKAVKPEEMAGVGQEAEGAAPKASPRFLVAADETPATYDLEFPMEFDEVEYRTVTFRKVKGKDFRKMRLLAAMGVSPDLGLVSIVSGLPVEVLNEMDGGDFMEITERAEAFIPARLISKEESGQEESVSSSQIGSNTLA